MAKLKVKITMIDVDYLQNNEDEKPKVFYDLMNGDNKIGSSLSDISELEAKKCLSFLENTKEKIEKIINK